MPNIYKCLPLTKQLYHAQWYVCVQSVPSTLSPEDFSMQLLGCLNTCSAPSKTKILAALQALHSQGLLQNTDMLYKGLIDLVPKFVRPHMVLYVQDSRLPLCIFKK